MRLNRIVPIVATVLLVCVGVFSIYVGVSGRAGGGAEGARAPIVFGIMAIVAGCGAFWFSRRR